jgi:hypothetical protein
VLHVILVDVDTAQRAYSDHRAFVDRMLSGLRGS